MELHPDQLYTLFMDNPNITNRKLSLLTGLHESEISRKRKEYLGFWVYKGVGLPFIHFNASKAAYVLKYDKRTVTEGSLTNVLMNLDRLIFCLDSNDGLLPTSYYKSIKTIFDGLTYLKKD